jgi:imidazolonepropionase
MRDLGIIERAGILCRKGIIEWVGAMNDFDRTLPDDFPELDAEGKIVLPGFVDSHTHLLFAGSREREFAMRAAGMSYQQIAEQGGGILSTVGQVRKTEKRILKRQATAFLNEMLRQGTTTVEIKSGYGLEFDTEIRMLESINELKNEEVTTIVSTFIGAHAIPAEFRDNRGEYIRTVIEEMTPYVGRKRLASFCDVFCEKGYFDVADARRILDAGKAWSMAPKIHADELSDTGGAELAASVGAVSADHLEHVSDRGISALASAGVVATVLPGVSFFLSHGYAPARQLINAGVPLAIASDFNPGSCMSYSMPMMMTIACTQMNMTPEEALTAATLNGAAALNLSSTLGSIEAGKQADLIVADVPNYLFLPYHFGENHIIRTIKNGTILEL